MGQTWVGNGEDGGAYGVVGGRDRFSMTRCSSLCNDVFGVLKADQAGAGEGLVRRRRLCSRGRGRGGRGGVC